MNLYFQHVQFRKQRDADQIVFDHYKRGLISRRHRVIVRPYRECGTNEFLGCVCEVKDASTNQEELLPARNEKLYQNFLDPNVATETHQWRSYEAMDYYYFKSSFHRAVFRVDYDTFRQDFPPMSDEESEDDEYDEIYDSTCVSRSIITTAEEKRGVRAFRIAVKTSNFPCIAMGESKFSFGLQGLTPNVSDMSPLRYFWDVTENVMIENEALIFTPDDYTDRIENAWLSSNNCDEILEFLLFVDFDASCLRFGLHNTVLPKKVFFKRNEPYQIRVDFAVSTEALMLVEVFNRPRKLNALCPQYLLNMYYEQAEDIFGSQWPDQFTEKLVDKFYFSHCDQDAENDRESNARLTTRKSLAEAFEITREPTELL